MPLSGEERALDLNGGKTCPSDRVSFVEFESKNYN